MSEAPMSAKTAIHRVARPGSARARKTALMTSESPMFCRMTRRACRLRPMA